MGSLFIISSLYRLHQIKDWRGIFINISWVMWHAVNYVLACHATSTFVPINPLSLSLCLCPFFFLRFTSAFPAFQSVVQIWVCSWCLIVLPSVPGLILSIRYLSCFPFMSCSCLMPVFLLHSLHYVARLLQWTIHHRLIPVEHGVGVVYLRCVVSSGHVHVLW